MDNYIGEIRIFAGNYAPEDWAICDGSLLQISENDTLFTLLGTTYGGDGQVTFGLPDLRGRIPVHQGTGTGLTPVRLGQAGGLEKTALIADNLPAHSHVLNAVNVPATTGAPVNMMMATTTRNVYVPNTSVPPVAPPAPVALNAASISSSGSVAPVSLVQPYAAINFIIATNGYFPSQS